MKWLERFGSTKFMLTASCLIAVFILAGQGIDVRQFEIIVPSILFFYIGGNVMQDNLNRRVQAKYGPQEKIGE